jgi:hypothetical protein
MEHYPQSPVGGADVPSPIRTDDEAETAARAALQGSPTAAWSISLYFRERQDWQRVVYWEGVALQNGSGSAFSTIGGALLEGRDVCGKMRGIYLLELGLRTLAPEQKALLRNWTADLKKAKGLLKNSPAPLCSRAMPQARTVPSSQ